MFFLLPLNARSRRISLINLATASLKEYGCTRARVHTRQNARPGMLAAAMALSACAAARAPSEWDGLVPRYGGAISGCGSLSVAAPPGVAAPPAPIQASLMEQTGAHTAAFTFASRPALKAAYLVDEHGTILSHRADPWDDANSGTTMTFAWSAHARPRTVTPRLVHDDPPSCSDRAPAQGALRTWRARRDEWVRRFYAAAAAPLAATNATGTPAPNPELSATLTYDWFNDGGAVAATFPIDWNVHGPNVAWVATSSDDVVYFVEKADGSPFQLVPARPFARGTTRVEACRLAATHKRCAERSLVDAYVAEMQGPGATVTELGSSHPNNTAWEGVLGWTYHPLTKRLRAWPKASNCLLVAQRQDDRRVLALRFNGAVDLPVDNRDVDLMLTCDGVETFRGTWVREHAFL